MKMTESRQLPVPLTPAVRAILHGELVHANLQQNEVEYQRQLATAAFTRNLRDTRANIHRLAEILDRGYEYKQVECRVELDTPVRGMAQVVRMDDNTIVETREMTEQEKQRDLFPKVKAATA